MKEDNYHIAFVNLDHRTDRLANMEKELGRLNIQANRVRGMLPSEYTGPLNVEKMRRRTPGAIGCHFSQVRIMHEARAFGRHAWVMEDDLHLCEDFHERFNEIEAWMETHEWDVFYLGSSFHCNPSYWHKKGHRPHELEQCDCRLNRDAECTEDPRIMRVYGAFATFAYIVNKDSLDKIITLLDAHVHESIGIDWLMLRLGPQTKQFCYVPGLVRQIDNRSDIGSGDTIWSGFLQLNGTRENSAYVFQERKEMFDPLKFDWHECNP